MLRLKATNRSEQMHDYLLKEAPELRDWLHQHRMAFGAPILRGYEQSIDWPRIQHNRQLFDVMGQDDAMSLFEITSRAKLCANLLRVPSDLKIEAMTSSVRPVEQPANEVFEEHKAVNQHAVAISNLSAEIRAHLETGCRQLQWLEGIQRGDLPPCGDPHYSEFVKLKASIEDNTTAELSPFFKAGTALNALHIRLGSLKRDTLDSPQGFAAEEQKQVDACVRYARKTLFPTLSGKITTLASSMADLNDRYVMLTGAIKNAGTQAPTPLTQVTGEKSQHHFKAETPEEMEQLLAEHADDPHVARLVFRAPKGTSNHRGG